MTATLCGQTAMITGAGSAEGIGFAIARRLLAAGLRVVITSTTERIHARARELDAGGEGVLSFIADLTVETEVQRLVDSVLSRAGRIHILVNNAGMAQSGRTMESNVGSAAYGAAKAAMDGMMRAVAIETSRDGITIHGVAPGWIATASSTKSERIAGLH